MKTKEMNNEKEILEKELGMSDEEWMEGYKAFFEQYADCPQAEPVECLDLIMKREWAEKILKGEKKVEFRDMSEHYAKRLLDQKTMDYIDTKMDDDEFMAEVGNYISALRSVEKIHFHNYNNTWFLDVSVDSNEIIELTKENVEWLHEKYDCHELDKELKDFGDTDGIPEDELPAWFYFVIDEVLDTNLPR